MNKKGFTLIELITTFALSAVIIILLINVLVAMKETYTKTNIKTELMISQGNLSNALNKKFMDGNLIGYSECYDSDFCYLFNFVDGGALKLTINNNIIKFGSLVYKLTEGSTINNPSLEEYNTTVSNTNNDDSFIVIKIPIVSKLYPNEDFGIKLVYQYNSINELT